MAAKREPESGDSAPALSFEQAFAQLEGIVRSLEDGQTGLDEALAKYEEGVRMLQVCRETLMNAERKIMLLTAVDAEGNPQWQSFSDEPMSLEEKGAARVRRRSHDSSPETGENAELRGSPESLGRGTSPRTGTRSARKGPPRDLPATDPSGSDPSASDPSGSDSQRDLF